MLIVTVSRAAQKYRDRQGSVRRQPLDETIGHGDESSANLATDVLRSGSDNAEEEEADL